MVEETLEVLPEAHVVYDQQQHPMKTFVMAMLMGGHDGHIHLEDDAQLLGGFKSRIEFAVTMYPDQVINFFPGITKYVVAATSPIRMPAGQFLWNQCVYFPPGFVPGWIEWGEPINYHPDENSHWSGMDVSIAEYLKVIKKNWIRWLPPLVQHREGRSVVNPARPRKRQSPAI